MKKIINCFDKIFHLLTAGSFFLVSLCVLIQIITRYTPGISAPWTDEMTRFFFLYTIMFGAPIAIKHKEYASIDILTTSLKPKIQRILNIFNALIINVVAFFGTLQALILFKTGLKTVSVSLRIPMWTFYVVPIGIFAFIFIYTIAEIVTEFLYVNDVEKEM